MASALQSRTRTLLALKPQILSFLFTERWFSIWASQDHPRYITSIVTSDNASVINGLRTFLSTWSVFVDRVPVKLRVPEIEVMDAPCSILDDTRTTQDRQSTSCHQTDVKDLFKSWGYSDHQISKIFERMPSLNKAVVDKLQSKLKTLHDFGFSSSDIVRIVCCRPRLLNCKINQCFDERIQYLESLFGSREMLQKGILRNPSLLIYDLKEMIEPTVELYQSMGITGEDLVSMLLSRPTLIPRTSLDSEKLEYIRRTGISRDSKMYKYVVSIMAVSRIQTIREKLANLEKFGFVDDEVFHLVACSPLVLTLSTDKVQRNMTFVVGDMRLPARVVLRYPFLLFYNLETILKPRMVLAAKIDDLGLVPQIKGEKLFTALRMKESRFVNAFIKCHPPEVAKGLMGCYTDAKRVKRLAEESKKTLRKGFPF